MSKMEVDPYSSTDFTYGIIILGVGLHITIMAIVIYCICRNNRRCQCCVIHHHDNNITTVVMSNSGSADPDHVAADNQNLIAGTASRPGIARQSSLIARVRTRIGDVAGVHSQGLPPPYDEESDSARGEINEGFMTVDLPTYEEYTKDNPPKYEEGSPPKYDEVFRQPE